MTFEAPWTSNRAVALVLSPRTVPAIVVGEALRCPVVLWTSFVLVMVISVPSRQNPTALIVANFGPFRRSLTVRRCWSFGLKSGLTVFKFRIRVRES